MIYDFQIVTKLNNLSKDIYDGLKQLSIFKQRKVKQKHIYGKMMDVFFCSPSEKKTEKRKKKYIFRKMMMFFFCSSTGSGKSLTFELAPFLY